MKIRELDDQKEKNREAENQESDGKTELVIKYDTFSVFCYLISICLLLFSVL